MDSIITVVDSEQIEKQMNETATAREQIVMADFVLLNKTDLVDEAQLQEIGDDGSGAESRTRRSSARTIRRRT